MKGKRYKQRRQVAGVYLVDIVLAIIIFAIGVAMGFLMGRYPEQEAEPVQAVEPVVETTAANDRQMVSKLAAEPIVATVSKIATVEEPVVAEPAKPEPASLGEFKITHYCACSKCCGKAESDPWYGITATGTKATEGRTIAVDPKVIPYGSQVLIRYADGTEHVYTAEDCGGAIKNNRIDVYMADHQAALVEGVKMAEVFIIEE